MNAIPNRKAKVYYSSLTKTTFGHYCSRDKNCTVTKENRKHVCIKSFGSSNSAGGRGGRGRILPERQLPDEDGVEEGEDDAALDEEAK